MIELIHPSLTEEWAAVLLTVRVRTDWKVGVTPGDLQLYDKLKMYTG